uniref:Uncharacterized protein n=1 Tax=Oryza barthii TaxID=65489 RepID=A0A0D3G439_9ORYZ
MYRAYSRAAPSSPYTPTVKFPPSLSIVEPLEPAYWGHPPDQNLSGEQELPDGIGIERLTWTRFNTSDRAGTAASVQHNTHADPTELPLILIAIPDQERANPIPHRRHLLRSANTTEGNTSKIEGKKSSHNRGEKRLNRVMNKYSKKEQRTTQPQCGLTSTDSGREDGKQQGAPTKAIGQASSYEETTGDGETTNPKGTRKKKGSTRAPYRDGRQGKIAPPYPTQEQTTNTPQKQNFAFFTFILHKS